MCTVNAKYVVGYKAEGTVQPVAPATGPRYL